MLRHYKGQITYTELCNLPYNVFHSMYYRFYLDSINQKEKLDSLDEIADGLEDV